MEAKDMDGTGRSTTVPLVIRLLDVNDNAPQFINLPYETSLTPDLSRLTSKIIVQVNFLMILLLFSAFYRIKKIIFLDFNILLPILILIIIDLS